MNIICVENFANRSTGEPMKKAGLLILVLALGFYFCGRREKADRENEVLPAPSRRVEPAAGNQLPPLLIHSVTYNVETLNTDSDLTATPVIQYPEEEGVEFQFRWLVNGQEISGAGATLEKGSFKKNDWVYCLVKAVKDGRESAIFRGDYIRVPNSPPQLIPAPVTSFNIPGIFYYQIQAADLDQDVLTYRLIQPLDLGIQLDATSGLISWEVDKALAERCTDPVTIAYEVSDSDGAKVSAAIRLVFNSRKINLIN